MHYIYKLNSEKIGIISSLFFLAIFQTVLLILSCPIQNIYASFTCSIHIARYKKHLFANFWLVLFGLQFINYFNNLHSDGFYR